MTDSTRQGPASAGPIRARGTGTTEFRSGHHWVKVSLPEAKTFYKKILDRVLGQAKLTMELRIDEAGKPFLWISTLKKS